MLLKPRASNSSSRNSNGDIGMRHFFYLLSLPLAAASRVILLSLGRPSSFQPRFLLRRINWLSGLAIASRLLLTNDDRDDNAYRPLT